MENVAAVGVAARLFIENMDEVADDLARQCRRTKEAA